MLSRWSYCSVVLGFVKGRFIYIFIDKNMLKTLIDVKFPSFIFLFLWHFFVLDMFFFFTQKLGCSIGLAKRAFFPRFFYGAPLLD